MHGWRPLSARLAFGMISCGSGEGFGSAGPMNDAKRTVLRTMVLIQLSQVPGH